MKLIYVSSFGKKNLLDVNNFIFDFSCNINLIYQLIIYYRSNLRTGNRAQKNRSEVNYSNIKLYKQKGTGMARMGSRSNPLRRGGGRTFPNKSLENFKQKINKKMYKISLYIIFYKLLLENKIFIIEDIFFIKPNLKQFLNKFKILNLWNEKVVLLTLKIEKNFFLSSRNYFNFKIIKFNKINPLILLQFSKVLISKSSLKLV